MTKRLIFLFLTAFLCLQARAQSSRVFGEEVFMPGFTDHDEVETLFVSNTGAVPSSIKKLKNLQHVYFLGNDWDYNFSLPDEFYSLTKLRSISIYNCDLHEISPKIKNLVNLNRVDLYVRELKSIPAEISQLPNLRILNIETECAGLKLPATLPALTKLKVLTTNADVLPHITGVQKMLYRNLYNKNIPENISKFGQLKTLVVNYNCLNSNDEATEDAGEPKSSTSDFWKTEFSRIAAIPKLDTLIISEANFELASSYMGMLKNTKVLYLANCYDDILETVQKALPNTTVKIIESDEFTRLINQITEIQIVKPAEREEWSHNTDYGDVKINAEALPEIELVRLFNVRNLPEQVYKMPKLNEIFISSYNPESEFTVEDKFYNLQTLKRLSISGTNIKGIDTRLKQLKNLRYLYINNPYSGVLPEAVTTLPNLKSLFFISDCNAVNLPKNIAQMPELKTLGTNATTIPELPKLENLILHSNTSESFKIDLEKFTSLETITIDYFPACDEGKNKAGDAAFWQKEFTTLSKAPKNTELTLSGLNADVSVKYANLLKNFKTINIIDVVGQIKDISEWEQALPGTKIILQSQ